MRLDKKTVKAILSGKQTELHISGTVDRPYVAGQRLPVQNRAGGKAVCRIILTRAPTYDMENGGWILTFVVDRSPEPRLLHKDSSHGYTNNPHLAVRDEPEAVDRDTLEEMAKANHARAATFVSLADQLADLQARHDAGQLDFGRELRLIARMMNRHNKAA